MNADSHFEDAVQLLEHTRSSKRKSGAKRLRKLKVSDASPYLLEALRKEVADPRTWETQYQLIMALGECQGIEAVEFLKELATREFDATMVYMGLGDALVRLASANATVAPTVEKLLESKNTMLIEGGLRAVAMMELELPESLVRNLIEYVSTMPTGDERSNWSSTWLAAAAAGWRWPGVSQFLQCCSTSEFEPLRRAASAAIEGKYLKWSPL